MKDRDTGKTGKASKDMEYKIGIERSQRKGASTFTLARGCIGHINWIFKLVKPTFSIAFGLIRSGQAT